MLILGLFAELSLRVVTAWKEPEGSFMWMLGKNRLQILGQRDGYRFFTGRKGEVVEHGSIRIAFNDLGYRSTAQEILPKSKGVFRVACFGDSVTLGQYEKDYVHTWPGAIEHILTDSALSQEVEVLNFGMAHYTYTTNLVNLALVGEYLQPDITIFLVGPNDFVCLYTRDYTTDGSHDGQWLLPIADAAWGFHPIGNILQHSRVCNLIYGLGGGLLLFLDATKRFNFKLSEENLAPRLEKMGHHLATFCTLSKALDATPVLCTYLYDEKRLIEIRGKDFRPVLDAIDNTIRKVAEKQRAILVEANQEMKDHGDYFLDDFHLTAKGGGKLAQILVETLKNNGLLPPATGFVPAQTGSEK